MKPCPKCGKPPITVGRFLSQSDTLNITCKNCGTALKATPGLYASFYSALVFSVIGVAIAIFLEKFYGWPEFSGLLAFFGIGLSVGIPADMIAWKKGAYVIAPEGRKKKPLLNIRPFQRICFGLCFVVTASIGIRGPIWIDMIWPTGPTHGYDLLAIPLARCAWGLILALMVISLAMMRVLARKKISLTLFWTSLFLACIAALFWAHGQLLEVDFYHYYLGHEVFNACRGVYGNRFLLFLFLCAVLGFSVLLEQALRKWSDKRGS